MVADTWWTYIGPATGATRMVIRKRRRWFGYRVFVEREHQACWTCAPPPAGRDWNYDRTAWVKQSPWNYLGQYFTKVSP